MNAKVFVHSYRASGLPIAAGSVILNGPYVTGGAEVDIRRYVGEVRGMAAGPSSGFVFEYDPKSRRLKVLQGSGRGPLEEVPTGTDLTGVIAHFLAWGAF